MGFPFIFLLKQRHKREKLQEIYNTEKRISEELHDGLSNDVFGLVAHLQQQKNTDPLVLDKLDHIYQTTRKISHDNAAVQIGEGFIDEVNSLIANYQGQNTRILTKGLSDIDWILLNENKTIALHRALKELMVNLIKHARATLASIQFQSQKNRLIVIYTDNGIGPSPTFLKGTGLTNTGNRIKAVGGSFIFEPKENGGAKATITIPIQ